MLGGDLRVGAFSMWGAIAPMKEHQSASLLRDAGASLTLPLSVRQIRAAICEFEPETILQSRNAQRIPPHTSLHDLLSVESQDEIEVCVVFLYRRSRGGKGWKLRNAMPATTVSRLMGPSLARVARARHVCFFGCFDEGYRTDFVAIRPSR